MALSEELQQLLGPGVPPFALLYRPERDASTVEFLTGRFASYDRLADLPAGNVLALVPFEQIAERGFAHTPDGAELLAMKVSERSLLPKDRLPGLLPPEPVEVRDDRFDLDDAEYEALVHKVVEQEIGTGKGANFVIKRSFLARIPDFRIRTALTVFGRLLREERGAYWTFLVHTGDFTLIGASPERHITLEDGLATMNPISGTYRYPDGGADTDGLLRFLSDQKESDELYMVLDEELKMMGRICPLGGQVTGPLIKPMARLAHTEYYVEGRTHLDARQVLRETMFAPTVTGSPLESACEVITRYEPTGRRYYAGALALLDEDAAGRTTLDSTIAIRTVEIDPAGRMRLDVGATLVRHSDPKAEAAETRAKTAGMLAALGLGPGPGPDGAGDRPGNSAGPGWSYDPRVPAALASRNDRLAKYWLRRAEDRLAPRAPLAGRSALIVDCEDHFTSMLSSQLSALGLDTTVVRWDEQPSPRGYDLLVSGPGPGDPRLDSHPKIRTVRQLIGSALADGQPLLAVCLSHQVLAGLLGLPLVRCDRPHQGTQRRIDFFGRPERCGFYNTYAARSSQSWAAVPGSTARAELVRDEGSGEVHAIRGPGFGSVQFHPESVLTEHGIDMLGDLVTELLNVSAVSA
jgi:2-amino-4-deoxychorismate synthase